jgi:uncharacterized protein
VLISAFAFGGVPERAVRKAFRGADSWISPQLLKEYRDVPMELAARGKITGAQLRALLSGIAAYVAQARMAVPRKRLVICRDPEDNMILECCFAAKADFLITGDRDLLEMDKTSTRTHLPGLKIISPRTFLRRRKKA